MRLTFFENFPPQKWRLIPRHDCCAIRDRMATHERAKGCHLMLLEFMSNPSTQLRMVYIMLEVLENHGIMESLLFMGDGL